MNLTEEHDPLAIAEARRHFLNRLRLETDAADVYADLAAGADIIVIDARAPERYEQGHIPGAINVPHRTMTAESTASLPKDKLIVTYCDGIGCNASTKAALKLSSFGFRVKEMIGGMDWWSRVDGYPVVVGEKAGTIHTKAAVACGC